MPSKSMPNNSGLWFTFQFSFSSYSLVMSSKWGGLTASLKVKYGYAGGVKQANT